MAISSNEVRRFIHHDFSTLSQYFKELACIYYQMSYDIAFVAKSNKKFLRVYLFVHSFLIHTFAFVLFLFLTLSYLNFEKQEYIKIKIKVVIIHLDHDSNIQYLAQ